jgi:hypothetical protein
MGNKILANLIDGPTKNRHLFLVLILLLCLVPAALAADDSTYVTDISIVASGARSMAMGRSSVASNFGASSIFANPAGTVNSSPWGITSMSTQLLHRVDYKMLATTYNISNTTLGVGWVSASTPAGYYTTTSADYSSPISYGDSEFAFTCASKLNDKIQHPRSIGDLSVGASLKLLNRGFSGTGVSGYSGTGYAADLGVILDNCSGTTVGASISNLLSSLSWASGYTETLPTTVKLGGTKALLDNSLTLAAEGDFTFSTTPMTLHCGAEYTPFSFLAVRAGVDQSASTSGDSAGTVSTNITAGLGINFEGFSFDYAYRHDSSLSDNMTHYFSISYAPEVPAVEKPVQKAAEKEYVETSTKAQALREPRQGGAQRRAATIDNDLAELLELDR